LSDNEDLILGREEFCELVRAEDAIWKSDSPNVDAANELVDEVSVVVDGWAKQDKAKDLLLPLLESEEPAIRSAAASRLLGGDATEQALAVLRELADNDDYGHVASHADTTLLGWRKGRL
jgi:hypothetical protein